MSGVNSIYTGGVNVANMLGSSVNLPEMGMLIQMERHRILEGQVKDQFGDMQKRNAWLAEATSMLEKLRAAPRPNPPDKEQFHLDSISTGLSAPNPTNLQAWFEQNGIAFPPKVMNATELDQTIQNLKSSIDTANTNSQMDMVRMQGLMDKMNQATDFMTNWQSKSTKTMDSIIQNIR
jgi:hypothetical protein